MAKTLIRGLELIEEVGRRGPLTITDLARQSGVHITIVSRTVSALEPAGWLTRVDGKIVTGPRCAILGLSSPVTATIREAEPLVKAIAGVTGVQASAAGLVGQDLMTLTSSGGAELAGVPDGLLSQMPVYVMAAGRAVAAQLSAEELDALLPAEPFPDAREVLGVLSGSAALPTYLAGFGPGVEPGGSLPRTRAELDASLAGIRESGLARDEGELHPGVHCVAVPWPTASLAGALACFGDRAAIEDSAAMIEACLKAAARPGAGSRDVIEAAARA
jgi:DNA-binding IclR family transcriptional regulator